MIQNEYEMIKVLVVVLGILLAGLGGSFLEKNRRSFENKVNKTLEKEGFTGRYLKKVNRRKAKKMLEESNLFIPTLLGKKVEDYVMNQKSTITYESIECSVGYYKGSQVNQKTVYAYGRFYKIELPIKLETKILVLDDERNVLEEYQKFETESIELGNYFNLFGVDLEKAFYLLTPSVILAFVDFEKKYRNKVSLSIIGQNLYLFNNNRANEFEYGTEEEIIKMIKDVEALVKEIKEVFKTDLN